MFKVFVVDIRSALVILTEMADSVILPREEEEISILDFHQSMVSCLKNGKIRIDKKPPLSIKRGIARMEKNELFILVDR
ncbi:MAG: hypothetical protein U9R31_03760 [Candidatus Omnitrophota bacterium]|nr:hypothetical protein [Candidatus Omnitrophota bacterium]